MSSDTIWHCDRCERETDPDDLYFIDIKVDAYGLPVGFTRSTDSVDLCHDCLQAIRLDALTAFLKTEGAFVQLPVTS